MRTSPAKQLKKSLCVTYKSRTRLQHANTQNGRVDWYARANTEWMVESNKMIEMWVDIVEDMTAEVALKVLPQHLQDIFVNVDPESKVCACRYRNRIVGNRNHYKLFYKGGTVS